MTKINKVAEGTYVLELDEAAVLCLFDAGITQYRRLRKIADKHRKNLPTKEEADQQYAAVRLALKTGTRPLPKAPWGVDDEECLLYMRGLILDVLRTIASESDLYPDETWMKKL